MQNVEDGSQTINVTAAGYADKTSNVTVSSESHSFTITMTPIIYDFTSYDSEEKTTEWGTGTAQATGVTSGDYTQIKVLSNTPQEAFVNQTFYILTAAETDGTTAYQLYSDAGTTGTGIYVTINVHE